MPGIIKRRWKRLVRELLSLSGRWLQRLEHPRCWRLIISRMQFGASSYNLSYDLRCLWAQPTKIFSLPLHDITNDLLHSANILAFRHLPPWCNYLSFSSSVALPYILPLRCPPHSSHWSIALQYLRWKSTPETSIQLPSEKELVVVSTVGRKKKATMVFSQVGEVAEERKVREAP